MQPRDRPGAAPRAALALALLLTSSALPLAGASHLAVPPACHQGTKVDVALVLDRSGSMLQTDSNPTTRMQDAKAAANQFLALLGPQDQSGLVTFSTGWTLDQSLSFSHAATQADVNAAVAGGATSMWAGIRLGTYELLNKLALAGSNLAGRVNTPGVRQVLILLTDGAQTDEWGNLQNPPGNPSPIAEAAYAKAHGITVFVIALGSDPDLADWYPTLENVSSTKQHFFVAPTGSSLATIFSSISQRIRDVAPPTVALGAPAAGQLYVHGAAVAPSPFGAELAVRHWAPVTASASDDCQVVRVRHEVDVHQAGVLDRTVALPPLVSDHVAPYAARLDCDALPAGRHLLRTTVTDFVDRQASTQRWFWCLEPSMRSEARAFLAWATNPPAAQVQNAGARLPTPLGGDDRTITANFRDTSTVTLDASLFWDDVHGETAFLGGEPSRTSAVALSRVLNLTVSTFDPALAPGPLVVNELQRLDLVEASVEVTALADLPASPWLLQVGGGRARLVCATGFPLDSPCQDDPPAAQCETLEVPGTSPTGISTTQCVGEVVVLGDLRILVHEQLRRSGPGFSELTVNALHIVRDTAEQRSEVILGQAYGGTSLIGDHVLAGPVRSLDQANDLGLGRDASGDLAAPEVLAGPAAFQGRIEGRGDVDVYALAAVPGEKVQVTLVPADGTHLTLRPLPTPPASGPRTPRFTLGLYDDLLDPRDVKTAAASGAPVEVELNVDRPGLWRWAVSMASDAVADYTLVVTRTTIVQTDDDDALLQRDAGESCEEALLVGPGVHLGTLEYQDEADAFRFQVFEKQTVAVVLRPGDTVDAADMDLEVYDPQCNLIGASGGTGAVKGMPELVTFTVPVGGAGLYRALVRHVDGIGTYELAIVPVPVTT